jgi:hypothetical protein
VIAVVRHPVRYGAGSRQARPGKTNCSGSNRASVEHLCDKVRKIHALAELLYLFDNTTGLGAICESKLHGSKAQPLSRRGEKGRRRSRYV